MGYDQQGALGTNYISPISFLSSQFVPKEGSKLTTIYLVNGS